MSDSLTDIQFIYMDVRMTRRVDALPWEDKEKKPFIVFASLLP
jgi:hypothetical protein